MKSNRIILQLLLMIIIFSSCATIQTKYYTKEMFQISAFEDQKSNRPLGKFFIKMDIKKQVFGELKTVFTNPARIIGDIKEDQSGDIIFYLTKVVFTTSWPNGWTSGEYEASGVIKFVFTDGEYKTELVEPVELWDLKRGEIRYFDDYYINEEGLKKVKDRMDRIKAVVKYLRSVDEIKSTNFFGNAWFNTQYSDGFKMSVKKILFDKNREFSPELEHLRKSETLLRDWEESFELMYMMYNFEFFFENLIKDFEWINLKS